MNNAITKSCRLLMDTSLRKNRLKEHPLQIPGDIIIYDRLETEGVLLLYEYTGDAFYMPMDYEELKECENLTFVAGISVSVFKNENLVFVDRYFSYYGQEEYAEKLFGYIDSFAEFYGYSTGILDIRKGTAPDDIRKCRCIDIKYW